jgi:hypothetical protein
MGDRERLPIEDFLDQIRAAPVFAAAAKADDQYNRWLADIDRGLERISELTDAESIELMDKVIDTIGWTEMSLKQRLLEIGRLMTEFRDRGRSVN